jgi:cytochrome P450
MDLTHLFTYMIFDTLSDFVFGIDRKLLEVHDSRSVVPNMEELLRRGAMLLHSPLLVLGRIDRALFPKYDQARRQVSEYMKGVLREHYSRAKTTEGNEDLFSYLQKTKDLETGELLSPSESRAEAVILITAGKHMPQDIRNI